MASSRVLHEKARNRPRYTPVRVLGAFVIGLVAVAVMTVLQHRERELLESTEAPTAVGDRNLYVPRASGIPRGPVAALSDQEFLYLQSDQPVTRDDAQMLKVAWWRRYHVYRDGTDPVAEGAYFLKIDKGRYLSLRATPPRVVAESSQENAAPPVEPPKDGG